MTPEAARVLLSDWFAARRVRCVRLVGNDAPNADPYARYTVVYEAAFEPDTLDMARVEIWITIDGDVAVGFETSERIARQLHVRNLKTGFAAGHEPHAMTEQGLVALLNVVAAGEIAVQTTVLPFVGLLETRALIAPGRLIELKDRGYLATRWLRSVEPSKMAARRSILRYRPWH